MVLRQSLEQVASVCRSITLSKIWAGASYGATAYVYQDSAVTDMELSSPQCLLLALLHSLITEEMMSCCFLANICCYVQQMQSDYLSVWLTRDFVFPRQDIEKAMAVLNKLSEAGLLKLPPHVTRVMSALATKYRIHGIQLIQPSLEGCGNIARCLEEAVLNNSPGDIIALANEGGNVNQSTECSGSLLHLAARAGASSSITALGFLKADLEVFNSNNVTPLGEAIKYNCVPSVKALITAGAETNKHLFRGDTYLHIAAAGGHNGALEVLLEEEIDVNSKNHFDETPLFQAVRAGNVLGVKMLLDKGADAEIFQESSGKSLLEVAVESQNVKMFKALVKASTNLKSKDGDTIFHLAARHGNAEMLKLIKRMSLPANTKNQNGLTPLHIASNPSVLKILIEMGLDVNEKTGKGETALHLASATGSLELVKALCQADAAVDIQDNDGNSAMMVALKNSKENIAKFLLHKGADPKMKDKEGRTSLHYAAEEDCAASVTTLLDAGARIDDTDIRGYTSAMVAAINNKPAVLQQLVEKADLTTRDLNGDGILHNAARSGHIEVVKILLDAGVEVDQPGKDKWTALHYTTDKGHTVVVKALLDYGANPSAKNGDDWTPLMLASLGGHLPIVQLLVNSGATLNDKAGFFGRTALYWAKDKKHIAVAEYLKLRGGIE